MSIQIVARQEFRVGEQVVIQGRAPAGVFSAVFEDDGETGYFYALDTSIESQPILDAVHIYNAESVPDKDKPTVVEIGWSEDNTKVVLLINGCPHTAFDFSARQGFYRIGTPDQRNES